MCGECGHDDYKGKQTTVLYNNNIYYIRGYNTGCKIILRCRYCDVNIGLGVYIFPPAGIHCLFFFYRTVCFSFNINLYKLLHV